MARPYLIPIEDGEENPFEEKHFYKIYNDGGHYVGTRVVRSQSKRPPKRLAQTAMDIAFESLYRQALKENLKKGKNGGFHISGIGETLSCFFLVAEIH